MQYDPIKKKLGKAFNSAPWLRKLLYKLLDLLLLRAWYIHRELKQFTATTDAHVNALDAGSGFGQYTYLIARYSKKWRITGVDVKTEQIDDCNQFFSKAGLNNVSFKYADLTDFKTEERYNLILCIDVMEHIEDDVAVFNTFGKIAAPGGVLLISTPSDRGGSDVHDEHDASFIDEHVRDGYNREDIIQKLSDAGFTKINVKYSYGTYGKMAWKMTMKFPITMLNKSSLFFILLPFYYLIAYPFAFLFNYIDVHSDNKTGTGLIVKAVK